MASTSTKPPDLSQSYMQSLIFSLLEVSDSNYLEWAVDTHTYLSAKELDDVIQEVTEDLHASTLSKALQALRRHLDSSLRREYIQVEHPTELWMQLQARFLHEKTIFLPQARHNWMSLRVMDFLDLSTFNSELHHIVAQLRLCGEQLIEVELITKTLSTFPIASAILAQQYRNMKFRTHAKRMSFLLFAEKKHQILLKNAEARPTQDTSTVETHVVEIGLKQKHKPHHQARRQVPPQDKSRNPSQIQSQSRSQTNYQPKSRGQSSEGRSRPNDQNSRSCHKCGRTGHIARNYRAS